KTTTAVGSSVWRVTTVGVGTVGAVAALTGVEPLDDVLEVDGAIALEPLPPPAVLSCGPEPDSPLPREATLLPGVSSAAADPDRPACGVASSSGPDPESSVCRSPTPAAGVGVDPTPAPAPAPEHATTSDAHSTLTVRPMRRARMGF
ncbi:MAG: hypothetical protein JO057_10400, partial [Chloroflexi bacterium]|nr:hypothetical protein [Chloroflexota bacterium]